MATQQVTTTQGTQQSNEALQQLLQMFMSGGTPEAKRSQQQRMTEINTLRGQRARFSPEAAFADAQGLMQQLMRQGLETQVSQILRSAEGAGTSQSSMRALLTNDALSRTSQAAAAEGLAAAQGYGQIGAQLSGILEGLTRPDNSNIEALLNTLRLLQESNQVQTSDVAGGSSRPSSASGSGRTSSAIGMPSTDDFFYRPGGILANAAAARATPAFVAGPTITPDALVKRIQDGLAPSQSLSSVPNINTLYTNSMRF